MTDAPLPAVTTPPRRAAIAFVLVTVVLDVMALGLTIPVLPRLIESLSGGDTARAAVVFGVFSMLWALMQIVFSPILGALSDRYGRRPVLLLSSLGLGLDYVLMALAPSIALLLVGRVINGVCAATFSTATAYVADVTPEGDRARRFGLVGAAFGVGFVLGPAVGGLLGSADPRLPFWVAACFSLANAAYGYFVLPESLPAERRTPFRLVAANPVGALRLLTSTPPLARLTAVLFLFHLAHAVLTSLFALYAGYQFGWTEREVGLSLAAFGTMAIVVQAGLIKPAIARLGEQRTLLVGLAAGIIAMSLAGIGSSPVWFMASIVLLPFWGLIGPSAQGLMSRALGPGEQGQLQGALASMMGIANIVGPGVFTQLFSFAIAPERAVRVPGAPFYMAALLLAVAAGLAWRAARKEP